MINLTLLGSGGGMPMVNRFLSSLIINFQGRKILIDCGEGTQVAMRKVNSGFKAVDIICITHLHGDHIFGLPGLLSTIGNSGRTQPITIIGPKNIESIIEAFLTTISYLPYDINIIENPQIPLEVNLVSDILKIGDKNNLPSNKIMISTLELEHSTPCLGYSFYIPRGPRFYPEKAKKYQIPQKFWGRLQKGETVEYNNIVYSPKMVLGEERRGIKLSYITDTRPIYEIVEFIKESDLFICEGTYGQEEDMEKAIKNKHMTFSEAATLAKDGKVEEMLLMHFGTAMEDPCKYKNKAKDIFENTIIGYDGLNYSLSYK